MIFGRTLLKVQIKILSFIIRRLSRRIQARCARSASFPNPMDNINALKLVVGRRPSDTRNGDSPARNGLSLAFPVDSS